MKKYNNEYAIIRTDRAGVFAGNIESRDGTEVVIRNVRRLWYWDGANSLSELASNGTNKPNNCKFTVMLDKIEVFGVIEIINCTEKAETSIKAVKEWKN